MTQPVRLGALALSLTLLWTVAGCQKKAPPPAPQQAAPALKAPKWSKPTPLYSGVKPIRNPSAAIDLDGGLHVALEVEGKVELLHAQLPGGEDKGEAVVHRQEFEGTSPTLVFTNNAADLGDYRLFLALQEGKKLKVLVLQFPPYDAPEDKKGDYPVQATLDLGEVAAYSLHGGLSQQGHLVALATTDGKSISLFNLSPKGVEKGPVLAQGGALGGEVTGVFVSQDAESGVHLGWNEKTAEGAKARYGAWEHGWKEKDKPLDFADNPVASLLFSQSSQVHFASVRDKEGLAYFSLLNDWLDNEIRGLTLGLDEMALDRKLNYEGAGDACAARVRTDNSPFFGHLMWLDGCGGESQGLGYAKVDLKEEKFIVGQHHLVSGPGLHYDFTFDGDNYLNLFYVTTDKGHYLLYHQTYDNQDRLPKQGDGGKNGDGQEKAEG